MKHKSYSRARRVEEQLQRELAELIQRDIVEPSLGLVTVSGVDVSPDLKRAKVFVSSVGLEGDRDRLVEKLNQAAGFLRHELGRRIVLKVMPALSFYYDETEESAAALDQLIKQAIDDSADGTSG